MLGHLGEMLTSDEFMPHGMCFLWRPDLLWLHAVSDALIALSYYSIPVALLYFVLRRRDLAFPGVFMLFGAFILACGTTHLMAIWTLWRPDYWTDGGIKLVTAALSLLTALLLWRVMPAALALPSRDQLEAANLALAGQVEERARNEEQVRRLNLELERRVAERTADLEATNAQLRALVAEKDVLLDEVRHRVRNNLQVVQGLLSLQARGAEPAARLPLTETLERVRAMGRVQDQLYHSAEAGSFSVDRLVRDMCQDLGHAYAATGQVSCRVEVGAPLSLPLDVGTPLALIVNKAVSNAYKHAFPGDRRGEIVVSLQPLPDGGRLEVRDDGVGLAHDHASRARQLLGMRLVKLLAAQMNAAAAWRSDGGTTFSLELPRSGAPA
jgi:two-component sensor histidine kinase